MLPTQEQLQEAMGLRAQIDTISERLQTLLNGGAKAATTAVTQPPAAASKVGPGAKASKGGMSLAQRKRLSEAMKQRWAARKQGGAAKNA